MNNPDILLQKVNECFVRVITEDSGIIMELGEYYTFFVDGYKFMPAFRNRMWDGKIRLFNNRNGCLPHGLVDNLFAFAKARGYTIDTEFSRESTFTSTDFDEFIGAINLPIEPRDYQLAAFHSSIAKERRLVVSPTGSGKSLIIYLLAVYYFSNYEGKILLVVPTTSLVEQMYKDFTDYSSENGFDVAGNTHRIYAGKEKINFNERIVITTWQSAIRCPRDWGKQFGMVIGDEAHLFKAKSLNTIMERLIHANFRIGTTGTLDDVQVNELVLTGHFGEPMKVVTTKALMDSNTLAQLEIKCLVLKYPDAVRKAFGKKTYHEEIDFIIADDKRNRLIENLALDQKKNTLILYNRVEKHGEPLFRSIQAKADPKRKIFFVSGSVGADERESIREITEKEDNAIIVASLGTFSVGINIKRLSCLIFAAPTKSQVRTLQSIGRGLRKTADNETTVVYDISDNLSWKKRQNYTLKHAIARVKIYQKEELNHQTIEINI